MTATIKSSLESSRPAPRPSVAVRVPKARPTPYAGAVDAGGIVLGNPGDPPEPDEIDACTRFILAFGEPAETIQVKELHSYALKHAGEQWSRRHGGVPYVSTGALLTAAAQLHVPFAQVAVGSVNAVFALRWSRYRMAVRRGEV
jgi:hypothetical protein